jgi:hypothetical protein
MFLIILFRKVLARYWGVSIIPDIKHLHEVSFLAITLSPTYFRGSCILCCMVTFLAGFNLRLRLFLSLDEMTWVLVLPVVVIAVNKLTTIALYHRLVHYFV